MGQSEICLREQRNASVVWNRGLVLQNGISNLVFNSTARRNQPLSREELKQRVSECPPLFLWVLSGNRMKAISFFDLARDKMQGEEVSSPSPSLLTR